MVDFQSRYVSQLTKETLAIVLAGGKGQRLHELTRKRAKPALHFGGKFRLIDFPLSNSINSGIRRIGVLTQYKSHSLMRHIMRGWGNFNRDLGEFVDLLPASQQQSENWYQGTADAFYQNIPFIEAVNPKYVVVLAGDQVYRMDYGSILAEHVENDANLTVACLQVDKSIAAGQLGVVGVNQCNQIVDFEEKPLHPKPVPDDPTQCLASMGIYVFNKDFLIRCLCNDAGRGDSDHDFGKNIIPSCIPSNDVYAFRYTDDATGQQAYWRDVGTLDTFWQANLELISPLPSLNLYDEKWPIWTYQQQLPPAKFVFNDEQRRGYAVDSMISAGCIISGSKIDQSVLFNGVRIHSYSDIHQSVVLPRAEIGRHCRLHKVIVDSHCHIPANTSIGIDVEQDRARGFRISQHGVVLVTQDMFE
ncbi:glucose-1-phosphate adenylyltransferase [Aestuariibacter sp. AA17]|uniref:Glucose-1-phosphate adenylyltransferase n=1 Tax=Fluctibacter corallii TaxID=2984329 RepID=A0ABT3A6H2_9ALTE|nr:glucose-1-phosphate adenylyltransferase [Aestuariibacter sp. AA17]MCV2884162.1 glucose-1-phosphate adenylyltransferase [Aestuariibacter sp. AA17]